MKQKKNLCFFHSYPTPNTRPDINPRKAKTDRNTKEHAIPDALSRAPVCDPGPEDEAFCVDVTSFARRLLIHRVTLLSSEKELTPLDSAAPDQFPDPMVQELRNASMVDTDYSSFITAIESGFPERRNQVPAEVGAYWGIRYRLSVDHGIVLIGHRIVIPRAARRDLQRLHAAHQGIVRTNRRVRQTVYWPGITNEITTLLASCATCQEREPSTPPEPLMRDPLPTHVFEEIHHQKFRRVRSAHAFSIG